MKKQPVSADQREDLSVVSTKIGSGFLKAVGKSSPPSKNGGRRFAPAVQPGGWPWNVAPSGKYHKAEISQELVIRVTAEINRCRPSPGLRFVWELQYQGLALTQMLGTRSSEMNFT